MNPNRLILLVCVSFAQQKDVASLNYEQLEPLLFLESERVQVVNFWAPYKNALFERLNQLDF